jgi:hypothetical protein
LVVSIEGLAQLALGECVNHQGQSHNQGEGFDALGLFDKNTTGKEDRKPLWFIDLKSLSLGVRFRSA